MEQFHKGLNKNEFNILKEKGHYAGPSNFTYKSSEKDECPKSWEAIFYKSLIVLFSLAFFGRIIFYYGNQIWRH